MSDDTEVTSLPGLVSLSTLEFRDPDTWLETLLSPDEARLLALSLIRAADAAEESA